MYEFFITDNEKGNIIEKRKKEKKGQKVLISEISNENDFLLQTQ